VGGLVGSGAALKQEGGRSSRFRYCLNRQSRRGLVGSGAALKQEGGRSSRFRCCLEAGGWEV